MHISHPWSNMSVQFRRIQLIIKWRRSFWRSVKTDLSVFICWDAAQVKEKSSLQAEELLLGTFRSDIKTCGPLWGVQVVFPGSSNLWRKSKTKGMRLTLRSGVFYFFQKRSDGSTFPKVNPDFPRYPLGRSQTFPFIEKKLAWAKLNEAAIKLNSSPNNLATEWDKPV